jgi:predicted DsbA family dithiol-disulfide isomerase
MSEIAIDVVSDVVCPWCFIGKRKLERALESERAAAGAEAGTEASTPAVTWHPFQLNPDMPAEGVPRADYLLRKFGEAGGGRNYDRVRAAGAEVGIAFAFERIEHQPNSLAAHTLIGMRAGDPRQGDLVEAIFTAYFIEGRNIGDRDTLAAIVEPFGLSAADVDRAFDDETARGETREADERARAIGVQGVPFFIFDRRLAVSGAQDPAVLAGAMQQAARDRQGSA